MFWGIIIGLVVGFAAGYLVASQAKGESAKEKVIYKSEGEAEKQANLAKIEQYIADKDRFTNDDLQNLLGVSDTTVGRYLDELEAAGTITQVGETGKFVYCTKNTF